MQMELAQLRKVFRHELQSRGFDHRDRTVGNSHSDLCARQAFAQQSFQVDPGSVGGVCANCCFVNS